MAHRTQGNPYFHHLIIKAIIKDTDGQPDEEMHRAVSMGGHGADMPFLGVPLSWRFLVFTSLEALYSLCLWDFFMEASSHRHDQSLTQSPDSLPFQQVGWKVPRF